MELTDLFTWWGLLFTAVFAWLLWQLFRDPPWYELPPEPKWKVQMRREAREDALQRVDNGELAPEEYHRWLDDELRRIGGL